MESAVFQVDVRAGTARVKNALFIGTTYAVVIEGYDYAETPPTITLSDHSGNPLAISEVDGQGVHVLSLDTQELLDYFQKGCAKGCVRAANVHCTVNTDDATLASSTMPVFWSQYYTAPSGTLTKIDVKGPKGDPGPKGDKGDPGVAMSASGLYHFEVTGDNLHVWASRDIDLYATDAEGRPDTTRPRWRIGDGTGGTTPGHLYYVVYGVGADGWNIDLGRVTGAPGEPGAQGVGIASISSAGRDAGGGNVYKITLTDGSTSSFTAPKGDPGTYTIDGQPTPASGNPVSSGGTYAAILDAESEAVSTAASYTDAKVAAAVSAAYRYKGSKATYSDLPASGNQTGDIWNVEAAHGGVPAGTNWAWNGSAWDALAGVVPVDSALDPDSPNPLANAAISRAIGEIGQRGYLVVDDGEVFAVTPQEETE